MRHDIEFYWSILDNDTQNLLDANLKMECVQEGTLFCPSKDYLLGIGDDSAARIRLRYLELAQYHSLGDWPSFPAIVRNTQIEQTNKLVKKLHIELPVGLNLTTTKNLRLGVNMHLISLGQNPNITDTEYERARNSSVLRANSLLRELGSAPIPDYQNPDNWMSFP